MHDWTNIDGIGVPEFPISSHYSQQKGINEDFPFIVRPPLDNTFIDRPEIISETDKSQNIDDKMTNRTEFIQKTIKKDSEIKELLLNDKLLNDYSMEVLDLTKSIFNETLSIESYSFELKKESVITDEDNLTIYVYLSQKVRKEEMIDLWKRISKERVDIIKKMANNQHEFEALLDKTTITLRRC